MWSLSSLTLRVLCPQVVQIWMGNVPQVMECRRWLCRALLVRKRLSHELQGKLFPIAAAALRLQDWRLPPMCLRKS